MNSRTCGKAFDVAGKQRKKASLKQILAEEKDLWQRDPARAGRIHQELQHLEEEEKRLQSFEEQLHFFQELFEKEDEEEVLKSFSHEWKELQEEYRQLRQQALFAGPYDALDAFVTIAAGAGGVDAQDWAEMLLRMIVRWAERKGFRAEVLAQTSGAEAGIKSAVLEVRGRYAYGWLQSEHGVHRLVRLSPYNANNLRQTSFARVEVIPLLEEENEVVLKESDLRIDTYRASGAGGQHVNKTDSAVRITHLPTGLVASCQSERSQLQNKERAMALLRAKLAQKKREEQKKQQQALRGEYRSAEWGNQIRSYILHPYTLVKDHRTGYETSDVQSVLDGFLQPLQEAYLRWRAKNDTMKKEEGHCS